MKAVANTLASNQLLLLFVVLGIGQAVGRLKFRSFSLGVSAVFFVALAFSAYDKRLETPVFVDQFGLVLFVYVVGLIGGPSFINAIRKRGARDILFVVGSLVCATVGLELVARFTKLPAALAGGSFSGALLNVPALGGVLEQIRRHGDGNSAAVDAVVGMSLTYPVGVLAMPVAVMLGIRIFKPDFQKEALANLDLAPAPENIVERTVVVTRHGLGTPSDLMESREAKKVVLSRLVRDGDEKLAVRVGPLEPGDLISVVGPENRVDRMIAHIGESTDEVLSADRSNLDFRRILLSNEKLAGRTLRQLYLPERYGAFITRVRRGDVDMVVNGEFRLAIGDRVRVVAPPGALRDLTRLFGDSEMHLAAIDLRGIAIGICAGLLLGIIPFPIPGVGTVRLGIAGGPIIVGLILGSLGRTGAFTWQLPPQPANVLRQIGIAMFFAGVGLRTGHAFISHATDPNALVVVGLGALGSIGIALFGVVVGYKLLRIPYSILTGLLAGMQTHPAVLTMGEERCKNALPAVGYSMVFPVAMVCKILLAQVLYLILR